MPPTGYHSEVIPKEEFDNARKSRLDGIRDWLSREVYKRSMIVVSLIQTFWALTLLEFKTRFKVEPHDVECDTLQLRATDGSGTQTLVLIKPTEDDCPWTYKRLEIKSEQLAELFEPVLQSVSAFRREQARDQYKVTVGKIVSDLDNKDSKMHIPIHR